MRTGANYLPLADTSMAPLRLRDDEAERVCAMIRDGHAVGYVDGDGTLLALSLAPAADEALERADARLSDEELDRLEDGLDRVGDDLRDMQDDIINKCRHDLARELEVVQDRVNELWRMI